MSIVLTVVIENDGLFIRRLGYPGERFYAGIDGEEMLEATHDLADAIYTIYKSNEKTLKEGST